MRAETHEIVPRYYGLSFAGESKLRIFDNPSTAAMAFVAITSPDKAGGLIDMLKDWQTRKPRELGGEFGYEPLFRLPIRQSNRLLNCPLEKLVELVRKAIHKNHRSYNLWDCSGKEAVREMKLLGETLTAQVRSQEEGWYGVNLKGAVRGKNGEIRYADSFCGCEDNRWTQTKGGQSISTRRNCIHVKEVELDSYLQDTRVQHHARETMKEKNPHEGERSLTFNFVDDPFLRYLIVDVLIAREVLGESAYSIDKKLLSEVIGQAITPLSLQEEVVRGRATFEIIRQKMRIREIDQNHLEAQKIIDEAFSQHLRKGGYRWKGHCLELGCEAYRYENPEYSVGISMNSELPFYVVRSLKDAKIIPIFRPDFGPQDPFNQVLGWQWRKDDRARKETRCQVKPSVLIDIPGTKVESLRYDLPTSVIKEYRKGLGGKYKQKRFKVFY